MLAVGWFLPQFGPSLLAFLMADGLVGVVEKRTRARLTTDVTPLREPGGGSRWKDVRTRL